MSTFQKLLQRFLGQIDSSYNPNVDTFDQNPTRRQRSFEALKTASCFSCGNTNDDRRSSVDHLDKMTPIVNKKEIHLTTKSVVHQSNDQLVGREQIVKQKRRAKTKLVIIRHGERVDAIFGDNWFEQAFDSGGTYHRFHSNLPISLPYRQNFKDYFNDPPLTELGLIRSYRTGRVFR